MFVQLRRVDSFYAISTNRPTQTSKCTPTHTHTNNPTHTHTFQQWCGTLSAEELSVGVCGCMCVSVCGCMCVFVCGCLWENVCVCGRNLFHIYPLLTLSLSPFLPPWITHPLPASLSVNVYTLLYSSTSVVLSWYTYTLHFTVHLSGKFNHFFYHILFNY